MLIQISFFWYCQVKAKCMEPTTTSWFSIPIETPHLVVKIGGFPLT